MDRFTDLDQSGHGYQRVRTYLGPSLGWVDKFAKPVTLVQGPSYVIQPGDGIIMVQTGLWPSQQIYLPDVNIWVAQPGYQPATALEGALWIKDIGGAASSANIQVYPAIGTGQRIDNVDPAVTPFFTIGQNRQLLRLWPIVEPHYPPGLYTGWFSG